MLLNSHCDDACNLSQCGFDFGVCPFHCNSGLCSEEMLVNLEFDYLCDTQDCLYDNGFGVIFKQSGYFTNGCH